MAELIFAHKVTDCPTYCFNVSLTPQIVILVFGSLQGEEIEGQGQFSRRKLSTIVTNIFEAPIDLGIYVNGFAIISWKKLYRSKQNIVTSNHAVSLWIVNILEIFSKWNCNKQNNFSHFAFMALFWGGVTGAEHVVYLWLRLLCYFIQCYNFWTLCVYLEENELEIPFMVSNLTKHAQVLWTNWKQQQQQHFKIIFINFLQRYYKSSAIFLSYVSSNYATFSVLGDRNYIISDRYRKLYLR